MLISAVEESKLLVWARSDVLTTNADLPIDVDATVVDVVFSVLIT